MTDLKIDLVYLWVNDKDKNWRDKKRKWQEMLEITIPRKEDECRYSNNNELMYSLRSIEMYAPWINNIFIITDNQIPDWLNNENSKINIIDHADIIPKEYLPTFNSEAIETCICNIPNLSEHFLCFSDDVFLTSPISPSYFFDNNGNPIIQMRTQNWSEKEVKNSMYMSSYLYTVNIFLNRFKSPKHNYKKLETCHCVDAYRKSYVLECIDCFKDLFDKTAQKKFRSPNSILRAIFNLYMHETKNCKLILNPSVEEQLFEEQNDNLYLQVKDTYKMMNIIKSKNPKTLCLNDTDSTKNDDRINLIFLLSSLFPQQSSFERDKTELNIHPSRKGSLPIVFCLNNNYAEYFAVTLQSIIENSDKNNFYDIIILSSDLNEQKETLLNNLVPSNFSLRVFNPVDFIADILSGYELKSKEYWSIEMYFRIFIPLLLKEYDRALYLDTDVVVNANIDELFSTDFDKKQILAVRDSVSPILHLDKNSERLKHIKNVLNLKDIDSYFNSGMIMFNLKEIGSVKYLEKIKEAFGVKELKYPDQDLLNIIFEGECKLISNIWNYCCGVLIWDKEFLDNIKGEYKEDFLLAKQNPKIIHYSSPKKPWHDNNEEHFDIFWKYTQKTSIYKSLQTQMNGYKLRTKKLNDVVNKNLNEILTQEKNIILWGASEFLEKFLDKNCQKDKNQNNCGVIGIIDKNPSKWGEKINNFTIYSPDKIEELNPDKVVCTIKNNHEKRFVEIKDFFSRNYPNIEIISDIFKD